MNNKIFSNKVQFVTKGEHRLMFDQYEVDLAEVERINSELSALRSLRKTKSNKEAIAELETRLEILINSIVKPVNAEELRQTLIQHVNEMIAKLEEKYQAIVSELSVFGQGGYTLSWNMDNLVKLETAATWHKTMKVVWNAPIQKWQEFYNKYVVEKMTRDVISHANGRLTSGSSSIQSNLVDAAKIEWIAKQLEGWDSPLLSDYDRIIMEATEDKVIAVVAEKEKEQ